MHLGISKNSGTPKWMVKIMENPIKMDDLGGNTPIFGNIHFEVNLFIPRFVDLSKFILSNLGTSSDLYGEMVKTSHLKNDGKQLKTSFFWDAKWSNVVFYGEMVKTSHLKNNGIFIGYLKPYYKLMTSKQKINMACKGNSMKSCMGILKVTYRLPKYQPPQENKVL